ncbi:tetratricopeptide repeat protein [Xanthomonas graminis]|nr:tetratricopeptide repeat protein [Xanthomonas translucens]UKE74224.1 tetratricopeptide repeat protein [Xanthomonas translucens pv. phleipratensis]
MRARASVDAAMRDPQCWSAHLAQAEALLMAVAASAPDDTAALTCLGGVLCDLAKYGEAAEVLQRAVRLRSDDRNTYFNLGVALLNSGKRRQAMQRFRQAASRRASAATWEAYFDPQAQ